MKRQRIILSILLVAALVGSAVLALLLGQNSGERLRADYAEQYDIIISEICTKNVSIIADNSGKYPDYIELYNNGDDVNLKGLYLTDGKKDSEAFGDVVLPSGAYRLVFLSDDVTGFALSASGGDSLQLVDPAGGILAQTKTAALAEDEVMLYDDGSYLISHSASPGFSNDEAGLSAFRQGRECTSPKIVISELLTENASSLPDEMGLYSDVVELYNCSETSVSLSGYCLSDSLAQRFRYRLPDCEIAAGEYLLIFCDGKNYIGADGQIHSNFGLSVGDTLCLTDPLGDYVSLAATFPGEDLSLARLEDGSYAADYVTLGYCNDETGAELFLQERVDLASPLIISEVLLSSSEIPYAGGVRDVVEIINRSDETLSTAGWYLSDGGDPYEYALPDDKLSPGECMVLLCEKGSGVEYTGFSLSQSDILRLTGPTYQYAPPVSCDLAQEGKSIIYTEANGELSYVVGNISLGYENTAENEDRYLEALRPDGLMISEVMSANRSYLQGAYGTTCDWVELYNASQDEINLADYSLSDDPRELFTYSLPEEILTPGEYCVILLSAEAENLNSSYAHLPFNLASEGDTVYLCRGREIVDYAVLPDLGADTSYGRAEGAGKFTTLRNATPGSANSDPAELSGMPNADTPQGVYDDVTSLQIGLFGDGEIYYTTDCSRPGLNDTLYTDPIEITETTVIRAVCYETGKMASDVLNLIYVVNEDDELAVASIIAEPGDLFSYESGIYMRGPNVGEEDPFPFFKANYWWSTERTATVSLFEPDGKGFSADCGISMFGGYSRALPKKSFGVYFRKSYGENCLRYPLFGEEGLDTYESFVFRGCGQDCLRAMMRDPMITSLVAEHTDISVQKYKPVNLYINGQYWGIYYIREKVNANYVAGNFNAKKEDVTICSASGGESYEYMDLMSYVRNHDLSDPECYEYVCSQVDVQEYMDYIIAEMWIGNTDNGNIKFCKTSQSKWNWIMYDVDYSFYTYTFNAVRDHLNPGGSGAGNNFPTTLINGLLENPEFKDAFLRRMAWQMETIWAEDTLIPWIDSFEKVIENDMVKDCERWYGSYDSWREEVEFLREFARNRNAHMLEHIQDQFNLTDEEMLAYGFDV